MFTITNGIILKGHDLTLKKENIVVDEGKIVESEKNLQKAKLLMSTEQSFALHLSMAIPILGIRLLKMKVIHYH